MTYKISTFEKVTIVIAVIATILLGLSAGANLTESVVLVSYWQSLSSEEFLKWFASNEPLLVQFFGTLQTSATVLTIVATILFWVKGIRGKYFLSLSTLFILAVLATFFLYFRETNTSFVNATIPINKVESELSNWANWQWVRTLLGTGAFIFSLLALLVEKRQNS